MTEDRGSRTEHDAARPFRHLCPEADLRDAMTEGEFWEHVFQQDRGEDNMPPGFDVEEVSLNATPCPICGQPGACAYDDQGLPLIHALHDEDEAP